MADSDTSDDVTTDPVSGKDKKSKQTRMLILIGVAGLVLTFFLLRKKPTSSSGQVPVQTGADQALAQYEQQNQSNMYGLQNALQALQAQVAGMQPTFGSGDGQTGTPAPTPAPTPTPAPAATSSPAPRTYGYGVINTAQGEMVDLGLMAGSHYNVGGGAPVFFGNAENLAEGPAAENSPGAYAYTPVAYEQFVSSSPT